MRRAGGNFWAIFEDSATGGIGITKPVDEVWILSGFSECHNQVSRAGIHLKDGGERANVARVEK